MSAEEPSLQSSRSADGDTAVDASTPPAVVTIAARHGAGGSIVAPAVAERLGVMFLDREVTTAVAKRTGLPEQVVDTYEQQPRGGVGRFLARLASMAPPDSAPAGALGRDESQLRIEVEAFLAEASVHGGVILGRGANFVLRSLPGVLCVLLTGPREARIQQAMVIDGVGHDSAEKTLDVYDEARLGYVRRNYGAEREEPTDYHLILDSTAIDWQTVTDIIVAASTARRRHAFAPPNRGTAGSVGFN